jgi:hypothetical protein
MTNNGQIQITEGDIRVAYQQKVNQVTNLELQLAALTRVIAERGARITELEEANDANSGSGEEKENISV